MRWRGKERSTNVQDRRGRRGTRKQVGGGVAIIAILAALFLGVDPNQVLQLLGGAGGPALEAGSQTQQPINDEASEFVSVILRSTEYAWGEQFQNAGSRYQPPQLVLFQDQVESACGFNTSATGPFYCPGDQQVYLDLGFLNQLERLGARGDFPMAYVISHEIGHHIQTLTGTERAVRRAQQLASSTSETNALSVAMELQADCYAGIWAHYAAQDGDFIQEGDIQEGLDTASAIGDDRLQRAAGRRVQPESFTHGTSAQRAEWFIRGFRTGSVDACDTFQN